MKTKNVLYFLLSIVVIFSCSMTAQESIIKEERQTIKTYPFSEPDPVPILTRRPTIYPYFFFTGFSTESIDKDWTVVTLENDYIKVLVLPEVGGKVYGAIEKSTGKEFIYLNEVLKFRQIAMRGPWTSGGTEFNFGVVGHTPTVATPVDYFLRENDDGSVSCYVGTYDLTSRTRWSAEIRLPMNKAWYQTQILWYNASPFHQSYYSWSNNAVKADYDLQYFYPGDMYRPHGFSAPMDSWPVNKKGRDLSWYKNNNFGADQSHFVMGVYENFFGGYWHDTEFGFGHWALYDDMPGKKMWIWALSRQGAIWEDLLTDTDGQYSEPQAGRFYSQDDHGFFTPYTGDIWKEIIFPYKKIGGMAKATPYGVLNAEKKDNVVKIGVCALQDLNEDLVVRQQGREQYREKLDLKPMEVYKRTVTLSSKGGEIEVCVGNKIRYTDNSKANDISRPIHYHYVDESTVEGIYLAGEYHENRRNYNTAMEKYKTCIEREPLHIRAMTRLAEIYCRRGEYKKALEYAARVLKNSMYDPDGNYIYGVTSRYMGNLVDAKETLGWAARSMKYRSAAYCQLAEIHVLEGDYETALEYARRSIDFNRFNIRTHEVMAIIYRKTGKPEKAREILNQLNETDPLNHLIRFEHYMLDKSSRNLKKFKSMIHTELPHESYLEMALSYVKLGLREEAVTILKNSPPYPTIYYWLAYLNRDKSPDEAESMLAKAGKMSPELVFPFREETIPVLEWVIERQPHDWKPTYYLGLIYWSKGRTEEALEFFKKCGETGYAPFYLAFGSLDGENDIAHYKKALSVNDETWQTWHYLIQKYNQKHNYGEALRLSEKAVQKFPEEIRITMDYASSLFNTGQYVKCLKQLGTVVFLPYEGGWEAHNLFMRTQIYLALEMMKKGQYRKALDYLEASKEYPERLGTGKPYEPDYRIQEYLEMLCYEKLGKTENAKKCAQSIYDYSFRTMPDYGTWHYFGALVIKQYDGEDKALQFLRDWEKYRPDDLRVQWALAKLKGDGQRAAEIEETWGDNPRYKVMVDVAEFVEE